MTRPFLRGFMVVTILAMIIAFASISLSQTQTAAPPNNSGSAASQPAQAQTQTVPEDPKARTLYWIDQIERQPSGILVNRSVNVISEPGRQHYHPDGTYNHDFKTTPDYSEPSVSKLLHPEQHRMEYTMELIRIGKPAVPDLMLAVCNEGYQFREYYCIALGEIKDLRAVPALLKYWEDADEQLKVAAALRAKNQAEFAVEVEKKGLTMKDQALTSLRKMTGQTLSDDIKAWQTWWESKKAEVGPIPPLTTYTANPNPEPKPLPSSFVPEQKK